MLGRSRYGFGGKTVRRQSDAVITKPFPVLATILNYYKNVTLLVDVIHVNHILFLATVFKVIYCGTIKTLESMKIPTMEDEIKRVITMYTVRGFYYVASILVNIKFKVIKNKGQLSATVNVVAKREHVLEMERFNRVIKEWTICYYTILPFNILSRSMVINPCVMVMFYINAFI